MATQTNPIIKSQASFVWWPSNDEYAGPANHFYDAKNIDTRRNSREVTLSGNVNNQTYAVGGIPMAIYGTQSTNQLAFCSNGYMSSYLNATLRAHSSATAGSSNYRNVAQFWTISSYPALLVLSSTFIHTVAYNSASLPWTVVENNWEFNHSSNAKPFLVFGWGSKTTILIWDWHEIVGIERNWSTYAPATTVKASSPFDALISIDPSETILGIFELWDQIVFFSDKAQYFWDWWNTAYDRRVAWDAPITAAAQFKTVFNVTTNDWTFLTLWETSSGYDRIELNKQEIYWTQPKKFDMTYAYQNAMTTKNGIVYFWGWVDWELNSYGYYNPWMPKVLETYITWSWWITCVYNWSDWGLVHYWRYTWTTYYVWYLENRTRASSAYTTQAWLMEFTPELWAVQSMDKEMLKIRVGYKLDSTSCYMPLYSRLNDEVDKYTFYKSSYSVLPTAGATYTHNSSTYTVIDVRTSVDGKMWINTQRTTWTSLPTTTWTLTKATGTGDASIAFTVVNNYRLYWLIDWSLAEHYSAYKYILVYSEKFNKIQFAIWLQTDNATYTPRLRDFIRGFNQIDNDL